MKTVNAEDRAHDELIESNCAKFLNKNWLDKESHTISYERVTDVDRQVRGADLILTNTNNGVKLVIDEKAKVHGLVNQVLQYPSFEIIKKVRDGSRWIDSWFTRPDSITTHYGYISIASDKQVDKNHEYEIEADDMSCMLYSIISKKGLLNWLYDDIGLTIDTIKEDAWDILHNYVNGCYFNTNNIVKVYKSDSLGKCVYLKLSHKLFEQPINLIIRRDYLRKNNLVREIYIDKDKVCKYRLPERFNPREETLSIQL